MPIRNYDGDTFVAFLDISGFKELMRQGKAFEALNCFYNAGYKILDNQVSKQVEGLFVSDCGILFVRNDSSTQIDDLYSLLEIIKKINEKMIKNDFMLTTSVAYGSFKYEDRIEFEGINKSLLGGNAYLDAYLDNGSGKPKIQPGQCRLVKKNFPADLINRIPRRLVERNGNDKHYYYYWMVRDPDEIHRFEDEYKNTYNLKYAGMLNVLKSYQINH